DRVDPKTLLTKEEEAELQDEEDDVSEAPRKGAKTVKPTADTGLKSEERAQMQQLIDKHADLFATDPKKPGTVVGFEHEINLVNGARPCRIPGHQRNPSLAQQVINETTEMLSNDIIRHSNSEWVSPVHLVRKKDGSVRFCVDFRKLNSLTVRDVYPLP